MYKGAHVAFGQTLAEFMQGVTLDNGPRRNINAASETIVD
jgi:hypothetical protein